MKPQPNMNTQILMDIQEQINTLRLLMQDLKTEVKSEIRGCKRSLDACSVGFQECKKGYRDIAKSYKECCKGYKAVLEQCEDMEDTIMKI